MREHQPQGHHIHIQREVRAMGGDGPQHNKTNPKSEEKRVSYNTVSKK